MSTEKQVSERLQLEQAFKNGADWFYWIAGLSIINTIVLFTGGEWNFVVGLGITQVIDAVAIDIGAGAKLIALVIDVIIAGMFVLFGVFAKRGSKFAFIFGMLVYGLDGMIFLLAGEWLGVGFHIFALFCIFGGLTAYDKLQALPAAQPEAEVVENAEE